MQKPTDEMIFNYVLEHRTEDFPMDQTLESFYKKVIEWSNDLERGNNEIK